MSSIGPHYPNLILNNTKNNSVNTDCLSGNIIQNTGNLLDVRANYINDIQVIDDPLTNSNTYVLQYLSGPDRFVFQPEGGGVGTSQRLKQVFVDSTYGNDGSGEVEKPSVPFQTIPAAVAAINSAATGTWMIVLSSGTHSNAGSAINITPGTARNIFMVGNGRKSTIITEELVVTTTNDLFLGNFTIDTTANNNKRPLTINSLGADEIITIHNVACLAKFTNATTVGGYNGLLGFFTPAGNLGTRVSLDINHCYFEAELTTLSVSATHFFVELTNSGSGTVVDAKISSCFFQFKDAVYTGSGGSPPIIGAVSTFGFNGSSNAIFSATLSNSKLSFLQSAANTTGDLEITFMSHESEGSAKVLGCSAHIELDNTTTGRLLRFIYGIQNNSAGYLLINGCNLLCKNPELTVYGGGSLVSGGEYGIFNSNYGINLGEPIRYGATGGNYGYDLSSQESSSKIVRYTNIDQNINSGTSYNVKNVSVNTIVSNRGDFAIYVDASGGSRTITLPDIGADNVDTGKLLLISKQDSNSLNAVTISTLADNINGSSTYVLYAKGDYALLQCDGSKWNIISSLQRANHLTRVDAKFGDDTSASVLNQNLPFKTITAAIGAASTYITSNPSAIVSIVVENGTYTESVTLNAQIALIGRSRQGVKIEGQLTMNGVDCSVSNLTVQNTSTPFGGAVVQFTNGVALRNIISNCDIIRSVSNTFASDSVVTIGGGENKMINCNLTSHGPKIFTTNATENGLYFVIKNCIAETINLGGGITSENCMFLYSTINDGSSSNVNVRVSDCVHRINAQGVTLITSGTNMLIGVDAAVNNPIGSFHFNNIFMEYDFSNNTTADQVFMMNAMLAGAAPSPVEIRVSNSRVYLKNFDQPNIYSGSATFSGENVCLDYWFDSDSGLSTLPPRFTAVGSAGTFNYTIKNCFGSRFSSGTTNTFYNYPASFAGEDINSSPTGPQFLGTRATTQQHAVYMFLHESSAVNRVSVIFDTEWMSTWSSGSVDIDIWHTTSGGTSTVIGNYTISNVTPTPIKGGQFPDGSGGANNAVFSSTSFLSVPTMAVGDFLSVSVDTTASTGITNGEINVTVTLTRSTS